MPSGKKKLLTCNTGSGKHQHSIIGGENLGSYAFNTLSYGLPIRIIECVWKAQHLTTTHYTTVL